MAIELCSSDESSVGIMSPARISFSHDVSQTGSVPVEQYIRSTSPSSSIDFDFCVFRESFDLESSSADELFFDGKILPIEIKRRISSVPLRKTEQRQLPPPPPPHPLPPCNTTTSLHCGKTSSNEYAIQNNKTGTLESSDEKQNPNSKSFWRFKRSSSCGSGYARTLCPLPLLSRSNSTGSSPSVKRNSTLSKDNLKHHSQRHLSKSMSSNGSNSQKPPLKKAPYNNGVKFSPVLNVPPANLFGLSTFFSSSKEKNKKK